MKWHTLTTAEAQNAQQTDLDSGLSSDEAALRLQQGRNELVAKKAASPFVIFLSQFKDMLIIILLVAATISLGLSLYERNGEYKESFLIYGIVIVIAIIGFFNEYKAEKTIAALKKLVGHTARVRRNGEIIEIPAAELVPGDVVYIESGQKIPADLRLTTTELLHINEASLTGESEPVTKQTEPVKEEAIIADRTCMAYSGTFVTNGTGTGIVVATGQNSEIGTIATLVDSVEDESTPMQQKLDDLGKKLGYVITIICALVFIIVLFLVPDSAKAGTVHRIIFAFTAAVALAVAAIPEGLAFVVRISLALGSRRMASKNALVRKLSAVEALGSTDVICSDKTGTLTKGEMTVRHLYVNNVDISVSGSGYEIQGQYSDTPPSLGWLVEIGSLCNDAELSGDGIIGDPTEAALLVSAAKLSIDYNERRRLFPKTGGIPFSSDRKMMSTLHKDDSREQHMVMVKGATEVVLEHCNYYLDENGMIDSLSAGARKAILKQTRDYSSSALRVLGFAYKTQFGDAPKEESLEEGLIFVGLQAMIDPPRKEVVEVVNEVQQEAGLRVVMITGDHIDTARAIASEIGIIGEVIDGNGLDQLDDQKLAERIDQIGVYARVNPGHKMRIVQAFKARGLQVAMTGDGVNDAPALKAADIGIAMGKSGSDVAKEAADLILLDDQFLTIIRAIEEGRGIFENVRKFVNFLISCNIAEVLTIVAGIIIYQNLLLTAAQLLFINIVTDGLPAIALGSDPARKDILTSKPNAFQGAIINKRLWIEIFIFGAFMSIVLCIQYALSDHNGHQMAVSTLFTAMVIYELLHLIRIRGYYRVKWSSNPWLIVSLVVSFTLQIVVIYTPPIAHYFEVVALGLPQWVIIFIGGLLLSVAMRFSRFILNRTFA